MKLPKARRSTGGQKGELLGLGRDLGRLRRRCRRLARHKGLNWAEWSAAVEQTNHVARQIGRVDPRDLAGLLVRYEALAWLLLEADDVIVDKVAKKGFVALGRAMRGLTTK